MSGKADDGPTLLDIGRLPSVIRQGAESWKYRGVSNPGNLTQKRGAGGLMPVMAGVTLPASRHDGLQQRQRARQRPSRAR